MEVGLSLSLFTRQNSFSPGRNEAVLWSAVLSNSDAITFRVGVGPNLTALTLMLSLDLEIVLILM